MIKYRNKHGVVDAFLLGVDKEPKWFAENVISTRVLSDGETRVYWIKTPLGFVSAFSGTTYIIRDVDGGVYLYETDIFEKTYERVTDDV